MNKKPLIIVVGPMKTGTTWLYSLFDSSLTDKEIRFPIRYGRNFVYNKYVKDSSILIWPYLLHEPLSLWSLLRKLDEENRDYTLLACWRSPKAWRKSMMNFRRRATNRPISFSEIHHIEKSILSTLKILKSDYNLSCLRLIKPRSSDFIQLELLTGLSRQEIHIRSQKSIYATQERAKINSRYLARLFFCIKPFLPRYLRNFRRSSLFFHKLFFVSGEDLTT